MAQSLAQRIKSRSGLAEMTAEELAAQSGRAPSTQPLETAVLGGTKDQAKMAGTPAQKTAALRTTLQDDAPQDLATRLRRSQVRREATAGEAEKMERGERLEQLGSLDERVQALAEQRIQEATAQTADVQIQATAEDQELNAQLNILSDPASTREQQNAAMLAINKKLGKTSIDDMLGAEDLLKMFGREEEQIADALVLDTIESGELPLTEMGFANAEELSNLIGADISQMTVTDLLEQVDTALKEEHSKTAELRSKLSDPRLGAAERAEARQQLRAMGAVGIKTAETDLDEMADAIQQADTVEYAGREMNVTELLGDDYMSGLIKEYLLESDDAGNPTSPWAEDFKEAHPELVDFITKHQNLLTQAMDDVSDDAAAFAKLQDENRNIVNLPHGGQLPEGMMERMVGDWGDLRSTAYMQKNEDGSITWSPELQNKKVLHKLYDEQIPAHQRETLSRSLDKIIEVAPAGTKDSFINEFMELSEDQIRQLGAMDHNSTEWGYFTDRVGQRDQIDRIASGDHNAVARMMGAASSQEFINMLDKIKIAINYGEVDPADLPDIPGLLEFDAKGNITKSADFDKMHQWMIDNHRPGTLQEMMAGPMESLTALYQQAQTSSKIPADLAKQDEYIQNIFKDNKEITGYWATEITKQGYDAMKYGTLLDSMGDRMSAKAKKTLNKTFESKFIGEAFDKIDEVSDYTDLKTLLDDINNDTIADIKTADLIMGELEALKEIPGSDDLVDGLTKQIQDAKTDWKKREQARIETKKAIKLAKEGVKTQLKDIDLDIFDPKKVTWRNVLTGDTVEMTPKEMMDHQAAMAGQGTVSIYDMDEPIEIDTTKPLKDQPKLEAQPAPVAPPVAHTGAAYIPGLSDAPAPKPEPAKKKSRGGLFGAIKKGGKGAKKAGGKVSKGWKKAIKKIKFKF